MKVDVQEKKVGQKVDTRYYPFGLAHNQNPQRELSNKYLYNGKELQTDLNLGWYDYGARFYQPDLGRWGVIDPLASEYQNYSPYNYTLNNPIRLIDPTGMDVEETSTGTTYTGEDAQNLFRELQSQHRNRSSSGPRPLGIGTGSTFATALAGENPYPLRSEESVGQPGFWEGLIPIWGSGRAAVDDFQQGNWGWGSFNTALAISDVFLVKSLFTGVGKAVWKAGFTDGLKRYFGIGMSHEYGNAVARWNRLGLDMSGSKHHWLFTQELMERFPSLKPLGNQTWNLTRFKTHASHMRWAHGQYYQGIRYPFTQILYPITSTPLWFKTGTFSIGGRTIE